MKKDKRKITVWKNGQQVKLSLHQSLNKEELTAKKEKAATLMDTEEEKVPPYDNRFTKSEDSILHVFTKKIKRIKPLIIAIASAFIIGSLLGITLLKMFVTIDEDRQANGDDNNTAIADVSNEDKKGAVEDAEANSEMLHAFVLQGGVFSEKANAQTWQAKFKDAGLPSLLWKKDNQYFLLISAAASENDAEQLKAEVAASGLEIYVKEWKVNLNKDALSKNEATWLQKFVDTWHKAVERQEVAEQQQWKTIIETAPDRFKELTQSINKLMIEAENENTLAVGSNLLSLWQELTVALAE
ncbi:MULTISPECIES: SPOR domain-containing protein [Clostridia]|uniref:SPOR domain-containing protein n=1 Tax=Clostridia TaxID=186801 RepID=UPI000EA4046F|nr:MULTISPECIES: SPOR domain-containing protein [Clostridia]NBJ68667.1 SPOR domain-containing protein [Roseburia sp. 1XD42-34]RKI80656.1 SPOR domain-containing protein [Clostridium sp. 1xD42-85]